MYLVYSALLFVFFVVSLPSIAYARWRHGKALGSVAERFGRLPVAVNPEHRRSIWIHAVSVGEALAARALVVRLRDAYPGHRLIMSTTTATGQEVARGFGTLLDATFYAPFDLPPCVAGTLDRAAPDVLIVVDTEIWPNLLRACQRRGVKTVLVNGRVSDRSFRGYRTVRWFMRRVLGDLDRICAQTKTWSRRFVALGADPARVTVTGSLKFDTPGVTAAAADFHVGDRVLELFRLEEGRPVVIAASTLRGEEEPVLRAFARVRRRATTALLIVAPRHPERFTEAERLASAAGYRVMRRTAMVAGDVSAAEVVILDTIGELARLYQVATVVYVGGSLVRAGGHNILEPAAFGKAIVFGPYMESFGEIAEQFVAHGAALQVRTPAGLEDAVADLVDDPVRRAGLGAAARAMVEANRGATARTLAAVAALLPRGAAAPRTATLRAVR